MEHLFSLHNISYAYGDIPVLSEVSLEIDRHDLTIITGSNGVGKTTLLKILAGLITPKIGIFHKANNEKYAYVAQEGNTYDTPIPLSVSEFVSSPHRPSKTAQIHCGYTTLIDCLAHVGLSSYKDTPMDELSGGQQQRALIARALMTDPTVLLLDEPTAGIDQYMQGQFYELIEHFNIIHGLTTVMITHDIKRQYTFGNHVICLVRLGEVRDENHFREQFQQKKVTIIQCP